MNTAPLFRLFAAAAIVGLSQGSEFFVTTIADEPYDGGDWVAEVSDGTGISLRELVGIFNANGGAPLGGENDGDVIRFDDRLFNPTPPILTLASELVITDDLVIDGSKPGLPGGVVIDAGASGRHFRIDTAGAPGAVEVTLRSLLLQNGTANSFGGSIRLGSNDAVTLDTVTITDCIAPSGGAIYNGGGALVLLTCAFQDNFAAGLPLGSGGALYNDTGGTVTIEGTLFADNLANTAGGAIADRSNGTQGFDLTLFSSLLSGNGAGVSPATPSPGDGGAIHLAGTGSVLLDNCVVAGNFAARQGGAVWNDQGTFRADACNLNNNAANGDAAGDGGGGVFNNGGTLECDTVTFNLNNAGGQSGSGGGIFSRAGTVNLTDCIVSSNTSNRAGGGIEIGEGVVTLTEVTLGGSTSAAGNVAGFPGSATPGDGGGLHLDGAGTVVIAGGLVGSNLAEHQGGGLWNGAAGSLTITGAEILDNFAFGSDPDDGGGGIFNNGGTVDINAERGPVTISRNEAQGPAGSGGGIFNGNGGTITITEATISENIALRAGGGIEDASGPGLGMTLTHVQLTSNQAGPAPGNGGGLHITGAGDVTVNGSHISDNQASEEGGGLWNGSGTLTLISTHVRRNTASGDGADQGGGGIFNNGGTVNIEVGSTLQDNAADGVAGSGGGIFNNAGGTVSVEGATISNNRANRAGGGIEDNSGAGLGIVLVECRVEENTAGLNPGNGGGLHVSGDGSVQISGGNFSDNTAEEEGGGLWNGTGTMTLSGVTVQQNVARGALPDQGGGGIFNNGGALTLSATSLRGNDATGMSGSGGGVMSIGGNLNISNSSLTSNSARRAGGGLSLDGGSLTLNAVSIGGADPTRGNSAGPDPGSGGGLHLTGVSTTEIDGGSIRSNFADREGGGLWIGSGSTVLVRGGTIIADNEAAGNLEDHGGGGVFNQGGTLETLPTGGAVIITNNHATGESGSGGGILNFTDGTLTLNGTEISRNSAPRAGGGIEDASRTLLKVNLTDVLLKDNTAGPSPGNGGGLHVTGAGNVTLLACTVSGNQADKEGGGLWNGSGEMTLQGGSVTGNTARGAAENHGGGGIFNNGGTLLLTGVAVSGNVADGLAGSGGGIFNNSNGVLDVTGGSISGNVCNRAGGGVEVRSDSRSTFTGCSLSGNSAGDGAGLVASPGNGGALHISGDGEVEFFGCSLDHNRAANQGGACTTVESGIFEFHHCSVTHNQAVHGGGFFLPDEDTFIDFANSTLSNNSARDGGGIDVIDGELTLLHATIAFNSATAQGGGINIAGGGAITGSVGITNSIVAANSAPAGPDIRGSVDRATFSLLQNASGSSGIVDGVLGNMVDLDPLLSPLADNGGATLTHRPTHHSPALDAGDNAAASVLQFDQRGAPFARVFGGTVDLGAYEAVTLTYNDWAAGIFTDATPLEQRDPDDDPEGDNIPNGLEWLTGLHPEQQDANPIRIGVSNGQFTLTFPRRKDIPPGVETLETSTNLQLFTPVPAPARTATNLDTLLEFITLELPLENDPTLFGRLHVQTE